MAIDPLLSGVRNETAKTSELYVTVDSAATPLYIAARTSGAFSTNQQVIDAANAGDVDASNWGQVFATPTVGENTKALSGLPGSTTYYYGFVQEAEVPPEYDFTPTSTNPSNAQPVAAAPLSTSAELGPTGLVCWDATNAQAVGGAGSCAWIARNNYLGRLTGDGVAYGNKQTYLFKIDPSKTEANLHAWLGVSGMGMGYSWDATLHTIDLTTGAITVGEFFSSGADVRFSGGVYGNGWVWLTFEFTIANGHSFSNSDQIVFGLCDTPGSRYVTITQIGAGGFHVSDAVNV